MSGHAADFRCAGVVLNSPVNAPRSAVFRCDGGEGIGLGHVARCLALAEALAARNWEIRFAVSEQTAHLALLLKLPFEIVKLSEPFRAASLASALPADLVVVDHYGIDQAYEAAVKQDGSKLLVIEDVPGRRHDADILLDATFGRHASEYEAIVPRHCRLVLGSDHALLRHRFAQLRKMAKSSVPARVRRVFVSFGGIDSAGMALSALTALDQTQLSFEVDVVIGAASPHVGALQAFAQSARCRVRIHVDCDDVAALLSEADIALGAAGVSSFERCALGVPAIIARVADNQKDLYRHLIEARAAVGVGAPRAGIEGALKDAIIALDADAAQRAVLSRNSAALCDGQGAVRVADIIETLVQKVERHDEYSSHRRLSS